MQRATRRPVVSRLPWVRAPAVLLVVPGTFLSVALGAIGLIMWLLLAVDYVTARGEGRVEVAPIPPAAQLLLAALAAGVVGGVVAIGAWIIS